VSEPAIWALILGGLGAIVGSFSAAIVLRWPEGRSVMAGRSACDACGRTLRAYELVPLLSAAIQRGRCRHCGSRIDPWHWRIEAAAVVVGVTAGLIAPGPNAVAGAVFGWLLLVLAALDWRAFWLPDRVTALLALAGIAGAAAGLEPALEDRLIGGVLGFGVLWAIATGYRLIRGREGLGGGDPKLLGAIGLWLGWRPLPAVLVVAGLIGLGILLVRRIRGQAVARDDALPLGTLMALAAYPAWLMMIGAGA
jgi:leader peptidase (prepilin peptidase)/N-methyltransferase